MSGLDSWEDDPAAQDDNLSKQTQQNLNLSGQARSFQPGAASFQPGAQSFQPGQNYQQYGGGGGYNQYPQYYNQQQQYGGGGTQSQYGQQGYGQGYSNQGYGQQNIYDRSYGGQYQNYQQQQPLQSQQPQQPRQTPVIAKRPTGGDNKPAPAAGEVKKDSPAGPGAKVLSISDTSSQPKAKVLSIGNTGTTAPKAKVLTIGDTGVTPKKVKEEKEDVEKAPAEEGAKVTAAKAIQKTGEAKTEQNGKTTSAPSSGKSSPTPGEGKPQREVDAVVKEQAEEVDEEVLAEVYGKEHVNIIFIGHVDAGKSTLGGSILYATGMVDERTMEKYRKEAKDAGRETWYLSWALDLTKEERSKGKTVEVGRGFFEVRLIFQRLRSCRFP